MTQPICIIIMGVSGSGKTTIGKYIAHKNGIPFQDGDDLHPASNIQKMSQGIPLTDEDRIPWLEKIGSIAMDYLFKGQSVIIACSALKKNYRDLLRMEIHPLKFIYLDGTYEQILQQMEQRKGHFMPEVLLKSQFDTLEVPRAEEEDVFAVKIGKGAEERAEHAIK